MPQPIAQSAQGLDLSARVVDSVVVAGSPALAAETVICSVTIPQFSDMGVVQKIYLNGWAAFTVGTSGTAITMRIRQTNVSGAVIVTSGALTGGIAAANLVAQDIGGSDATPGVATYALTLQVTAGAAVSTVSAVQLLAIVV